MTSAALTRGELPRILLRLRDLVSAEASASFMLQLEEEIKKLSENTLYVVILGQFKRGKSSLINALLDDRLLPCAIVPVTSAVTMIHPGTSRSASVLFADGRREPIPIQELPQFLSEQWNPGNTKGVRAVEISHPSPLLGQGIVLVDTPGIGSVEEKNTKSTWDFVPRVDVAVIVFSPDPPITEVEMNFVRHLRAEVVTVFIVMNKIDAYSPDECSEALSYLHSTLEEKAFDRPIHIYPLSARRALEAQGGESGVEGLRAALTDLRKREGDRVLFEQTRKRIAGLIQEAIFQGELALRAALLPLETLKERTRIFEEHARTVRQREEESVILIRGKIDTLKQRIGDELEGFSRGATSRVRSALRAQAQASAGRSPREFQQELQTALTENIRTEFDSWRAANEQRLLGGFGDIAGTYVHEANGLIQEVRTFTAELFSVDLHEVPEPELVGWDGDFRYKTTDELQFLEIDPARLESLLLPRTLFQKKVLSRFLHSAEDKVARNAGRLRSEYVSAIDESVRRLTFALHARMDALIEQVQSVLHRATADIPGVQASARPRAEKAHEFLSALRALHQQVHAGDQSP